MNSKTLLISVFVLFVFVSGTIYFTYNKEENGLYYSIEKSENSDIVTIESPDITEDSKQTIVDETQTIIIHVYGCIMDEGVYHLTSGARVYEVLELAGGYKPGASKGYVNLARFLEDGESIYFPSVEEEEELAQVEVQSIDDGLTNINSATVDQLIDLPGIGEAKARSIIAYRTMNGDFMQIEDIMNVSGIKESLFMTIKDMIRI